MDGLDVVHFKLSASKLREEGTPATTGTILGHGFDLVRQARFVTAHKRLKISVLFASFLSDHSWIRKDLERGIGLLQSVRRDVTTRWRLQELYRVLHTPGFGPLEVRLQHQSDSYPLRKRFVLPTSLAKRTLAAVLHTLGGERKFNWSPTPWPTPTHTLTEWCPMLDAATFGGVLLVGSTLYYFSGKWPAFVRDEIVIPIFVLEALTVILGALTWGHLFQGKKVLFRSDSKNACGALNRLTSRNECLRLVANLWADIQGTYDFEGLVFHCPGVSNQWADAASRLPLAEVPDALRQESNAIGQTHVVVTHCETKWSARGLTAAVLDTLYNLSVAQQEETLPSS
jgi:hypothetical protein